MTKLAELKAAYEAATPGEWEQVGYNDLGRYVQTLEAGEVCSIKRGKWGQIKGKEYQANAAFIALAHNNMAALLEAVELLNNVSIARAHQSHSFDVNGWYVQVRSLLESLK